MDFDITFICLIQSLWGGGGGSLVPSLRSFLGYTFANLHGSLALADAFTLGMNVDH